MAVDVDFVQRADSFLLTGPYRIGKKTRHGSELSTHHIAITLVSTTNVSQAAFNREIYRLSSAGAVLDIAIPLKRFDGFLLTFSTSFMLSCATGWEQPDTFPTLSSLQSSECTTSAHAASGAVLLAASPPRLNARHDARQLSLMAHFAARALSGSMPFDAVVIPILVNNTVEDRNTCRDSQCISLMENQNTVDFEHIRHSIEEEFRILDLPRSKWSRLILLPFCRLGSAATQREHGAPCALDYQYGLYHAFFFTYLMAAPYFKWAASLELDEFFAPNSNSIHLPTNKIVDVFDLSNIFAGGSMCYQHVNFRINEDYSREMTIDFMRGTGPTLRGRNASDDCFQNKDSSGKCAVRCDVGLGFTIRTAVVRHNVGNDRLDMRQRVVRSRQLRAWRPRRSGRNLKCEYVP